MANLLFDGLQLHARAATRLSLELIEAEWRKYQNTRVARLSGGRWAVENGMIPALCWNNADIFHAALPSKASREQLIELIRTAKINLESSQVIDPLGGQISSLVLNFSPF